MIILYFIPIFVLLLYILIGIICYMLVDNNEDNEDEDIIKIK